MLSTSYISLAALLLTCVAGSRAAKADEPAKKETRKVIATAIGIARVRPDEARILFVVTTTEVPAKNARDANSKAVKAMRDALAAPPLSKANIDVQVTPITIDSLATVPTDELSSRVTHAKRARSLFSVIVREKDLNTLRELVGRITEAAVDHGGSGPELETTFPRAPLRFPRGVGANEPLESVRGPVIEWRAQNMADARRDAIRQAVHDATSDAKAAAGDAPLTILEIDVSGAEDSPAAARVRSALGAVSTDELGEVTIKVVVKMTCTY